MIMKEGDDIMIMPIKNSITNSCKKKHRQDKPAPNIQERNGSLTNYSFR